ncbi:ADP-ribosylation factor-like protein 16 isoform 4-T4 [Liasis olivaceus]
MNGCEERWRPNSRPWLLWEWREAVLLSELQKWCQGPWRATSNFANGKKITIRELGGCMGPIWSSYYSDCHAVLYMIDAANPTQISSSCVQLLSLLSAEQLTSVPVLLIFNKIDLPCYMSLVEMKSLLRIQDIISCAKQAITVVEISARDGRGLSDVIKWLQSTLRD